jgi:outer membrane biosynthesis protein TonB
VKSDYLKFILASLLLHVLFLSFLGLFNLLLFFTNKPATNTDESPLVFELQDSKRRHEVVETPEDARLNEFQKNAELASDKNALARDDQSDSELPMGAAFSSGDLDVKELPTNPLPPGERGALSNNHAANERPEKPEVENQESAVYAANYYEKFSRDYLTQNPVKNPGASENRPKPLYDNQLSQALEKGGLSFNTYEWNFAPYMLALKKRVESNIFPPPAFTYMGIISGETLLRFKIYPNGEMKELQLIEYTGHETLMQTSWRAIEVSAPFLPLPADFPEPYLEVTAKFSYLVSQRK